MAKRTAYLHIGPAHSGSHFVETALATHTDALAERGIRLPARSGEEMFRAVVEIRRVHKAWGYRRREVEGTWSAICRRAHKAKATVVLTQPHLAAAGADEIALLLDRLDGFDVHVVITAPPPGRLVPRGAVEELSDLVERWSAAVRGPERLHVITPPTGDHEPYVWAELGRIVGFDPAELPLPDNTDDLAGADATAEDLLVVALDELERQRVRNAVLEVRNEELARKRKKLKRRLSDALAG